MALRCLMRPHVPTTLRAPAALIGGSTPPQPFALVSRELHKVSRHARSSVVRKSPAASISGIIASTTPSRGVEGCASRRRDNGIRPTAVEHVCISQHRVGIIGCRRTFSSTSSDSTSKNGSRYGWLHIAGAGLALSIVTLTVAKTPSLLAEAPPRNDSDEDQMEQNEYQQLDEESVKKYAPTLEDQEEMQHRRRPSFVNKLQVVIVRYIAEPIGTAKRFIVLVFIFLPVLLTMPMLLVGRRREGGRRRGRRVSKTEKGQRWGAMWWFSYLVRSLERAGPTFIKLAQWAGSRQDLFPKELCDMFGKLHSNGKPHPLAYTKKVIEKVFGGRKFEEIFEEFQEEPMGIGAVAQVYKAKLKQDLLPPQFLEAKHASPKAVAKKDSPTKKLSKTLALTFDEDEAPPKIPTGSVAIKILHPKVERTIRRDIKIMSFFANVINLLPGAQWLSFPEEVKVFSGMMFSQLDLRNEAENLLRFEENFGKRRNAVNFPRPLPQFSTKELLIEEFEDALPLKYFLNMGGAGFDHRIANLGLDTFLNMLLIDNFTHADLHPGNIMVKFYRPTTQSLLRDLLHRILAKFDKDYAPGAKKGSIRLDEMTDETVLAKLRPLHRDQDAWLDALQDLDDLGYQPELVFLDAGLTVELSPLNRRNFIDLFAAVAEFDGALAGYLMVERCRTPNLVIDEDTFALRMQDLVLSVKSKTFSLAQIKISDVLSQVLKAVREHHVKMEPDFVNTVISILLLEGIGRQLDPNMDLFKSALPILRSLGRQMSHSHSVTPTNLREMGPLLKLWLYMEARSWLTSLAERNTVEAFVRYDWFSTGV